MKEFELHQKHEEEIKTLLIQEGCMISGQIRRWKNGVWPKLKELGHTSLDFNECRCKKSPAI